MKEVYRLPRPFISCLLSLWDELAEVFRFSENATIVNIDEINLSLFGYLLNEMVLHLKFLHTIWRSSVDIFFRMVSSFPLVNL